MQTSESEVAEERSMDANPRHRQISMITACFVIAVVIFAGVAGDAAVLCVGDDGHVDLETTITECCLNAVPAEGWAPILSIERAGGGCSDCVDLGIEVESLKAGKKSVAVPSPVAVRHVDLQFTPERVAVHSLSSCDKLDWLSDSLASVILLT